MMQMRTHTCNELRLEHVGQSVKLVGWMENVRAVGQNFAFVVRITGAMDGELTGEAAE